MKKRIALVLVLAMLVSVLSGCCLQHEWVEANCVDPMTCAKCEKTEGEALGHTMAEADCVTPATCSICGETEGEALGHEITWVASTENFEEMTGTCDVCGEAQVEAVDWEAVAPSFILGHWDGAMVQVDGQFYDLDEGITFDIREDGTATLDMVDEQFALTWSVDEALRYSEDFTVEVLSYNMVDDEGGEYTLAITYSFGREMDSCYFYIGDKVLVFQK
jgi:hypothetical protein